MLESYPTEPEGLAGATATVLLALSAAALAILTDPDVTGG